MTGRRGLDHPNQARHSRGGGNPDWLASHHDHRPPRIWIPACAGMTTRRVTRGSCVMATKAMMPMERRTKTPSPSGEGRGGACPRERAPHGTAPLTSNEQLSHPPARRVSPRRRGPRLGSRLRGRTRKRQSACAGTRALPDPTTTPDAPKDGEIAQTPPPLADTLIRCPTRASERTLRGCPTPPLSRLQHPRPGTPLSNPYRAMCRTL